jgi:2'-5' RNA ligase
VRLFFALPLPAAIRAELTALRAGPLARPKQLRWVREEQLHLTFRFLGEVEPSTVDALVAGVDPAGWPPAPTLRLRGLGRFGSPRRPRVLWVGVTPAEPLAAVAGSLESAAQAAGLPAEARPFAPHVTLGRVKAARAADIDAFLREHAGFETEPFVAEEVVLYRSTLGSRGAIHELLERFRW